MSLIGKRVLHKGTVAAAVGKLGRVGHLRQERGARPVSAVCSNRLTRPRESAQRADERLDLARALLDAGAMEWPQELANEALVLVERDLQELDPELPFAESNRLVWRGYRARALALAARQRQAPTALPTARRCSKENGARHRAGYGTSEQNGARHLACYVAAVVADTIE